jgi:N,N'-diacetyllegionaminate synthase
MKLHSEPGRPLLIAEIGGNHEGDFDTACRLADLAVEAGADAVKFQIYFGDTLVSARESPERNAHFKCFELTEDQHLNIAQRVRDAGRAYVASVWDIDAFAWIDPVISAYKVGSGDLTAPQFLDAAADTGRPLILATGLSEITEVERAVDQIRASRPAYLDRSMLAVLQCTSLYPTCVSDVNLLVMEAYRPLGVTVGYSDHTIGSRALEIAAAMGAEVLEFHFTDRKQGRSFRDHQLSLDSRDLRSLLGSLDEIAALRGSAAKRPVHSEIDSGHLHSFRRAVYPSRDIEIGEPLNPDNVCLLRPNQGIDAREYAKVLGRHARRRLARHEALDWRDLD